MNKDKPVKKAKKKAEPFVSKYPPIDYNKIHSIEKIDLSIQLDQVLTEYKNIDISVPTNITLGKVAQIINEKNNMACKNIKLYFITKELELQSLDNFMDKTFIDLGISKKDSPLTMYYSFEAVQNQLLLAGYYN